MKITQYPSPNFSCRTPGRAVDAVVIHYTDLTLAQTMALLCMPDGHASTHYVISRRGRVFQLVAEEAKAWHAGVSELAGLANVNDFSIGIDLVFKPGLHSGYTRSQYRALVELISDIRGRHPVSQDRIVGHEHVALPPGRKQDPGPWFDWTAVRTGAPPASRRS